MTGKSLGFVGLGNMGAAMVANMAGAGHAVSVFDKAGTAERAPAGADVAGSIEDLARLQAIMFVCVPDGAASKDVVRAIAATDRRRAEKIVNLSTTGIAAAEDIAAMLEGGGIDYVDAPVSGGRSGAVRGTITVMWSGSKPLFDDLRPVLETFSTSQFFVGARPGQGQALKLLNNFLSAVAMTATSEAMLFGESMGLDMKTMLDAVNVSTGRNTATSDKFPNRVATGTFNAGFRLALMEKDVALYLKAARAAGSPDRLSSVVGDYLRKGVEAFPDGDFTDIFRLIKKGKA